MTRTDNIRVIKIPLHLLRLCSSATTTLPDSCEQTILVCFANKGFLVRVGETSSREKEGEGGRRVRHGGSEGRRKKEGWKVKRGCWKTGAELLHLLFEGSNRPICGIADRDPAAIATAEYRRVGEAFVSFD